MDLEEKDKIYYEWKISEIKKYDSEYYFAVVKIHEMDEWTGRTYELIAVCQSYDAIQSLPKKSFLLEKFGKDYSLESEIRKVGELK